MKIFLIWDSDKSSSRFFIRFPKLKSQLKTALQIEHFLMLALLPRIIHCVKFNKKKATVHCRQLQGADWIIIYLYKICICKELISDGTGHLLILGQSSFVSVWDSIRSLISSNSKNVSSQIKFSLFSASVNTLTLISYWQKNNSILLRADDQRQYLLMLQSTNKNLVTDVSVLYANRNFMDQFSFPPWNICSWKIEIQLHGTKRKKKQTPMPLTEQAAERKQAIDVKSK